MRHCLLPRTPLLLSTLKRAMRPALLRWMLIKLENKRKTMLYPPANPRKPKKKLQRCIRKNFYLPSPISRVSIPHPAATASNAHRPTRLSPTERSTAIVAITSANMKRKRMPLRISLKELCMITRKKQ